MALRTPKFLLAFLSFRLFAVLAFVAACGFPILAPAADLEFAGTTYKLANVTVAKDGTITNDYYQAGESETNWSSFVSVRFWPKADDVQEVASSWLEKIQALLVRETVALPAKYAKNKDDVVIEAWLAPENESYLEIDLHRFVIEPGSKAVKGYLIGRRTPPKDGKLDPRPYIAQRQAYFEALSVLKLDAVKEMP